MWLLFLLLYAGAYGARGWKHTASLVGMLLLGIFYLPLNYGSVGVFIYFAAAVAASISSGRRLAWILCFECLCVALEISYFHLDSWVLSTGVLLPLIVGITVFSETQQRKSDARLRLAHEEIEHLAKRAERERIARDMHDVLGHTLSMIVLKSELAGRLVRIGPGKGVQRNRRYRANGQAGSFRSSPGYWRISSRKPGCGDRANAPHLEYRRAESGLQCRVNSTETCR